MAYVGILITLFFETQQRINADNEVFSDKMVVFILDEIRIFNQQNLNSYVLVEKSKIFAPKKEKQILRQAEDSICIIFFKKSYFWPLFQWLWGKRNSRCLFFLWLEEEQLKSKSGKQLCKTFQRFILKKTHMIVFLIWVLRVPKKNWWKNCWGHFICRSFSS